MSTVITQQDSNPDGEAATTTAPATGAAAAAVSRRIVSRMTIFLATAVVTTLCLGGLARAESSPCTDVSLQSRCIVDAIFRAYVPERGADRKDGAGGTLLDPTSPTAVIGEAAQILGQIVVDRASQAAYVLITKKLLHWMHCHPEDGGEPAVMSFPATCKVIDSLRAQDLAMTPGTLQQALAGDALAFLTGKLKDTRAVPRSLVPGTPAAGRAVMPAALTTTPSSANTPARGDLVTLPTIFQGGVQRLVPLLARPLEALTGRSAEVEVRNMVARGLEGIAGRTTDAFCSPDLKDQNRVLATSALAFAACELDKTTRTTACPVMQYVTKIDASCAKEVGLKPAQLLYAQSLAADLVDALTLTSAAPQQATGKDRLVAATSATFKIACMYAVDGAGENGYECRVLDKQDCSKDQLENTEVVALARDVARAALDRDGAGLAAVIVRAVVRCLPNPDTVTAEHKALRALATIAAYASTYTSPQPDRDAHQQRTALLESLTRDMTVRTDRGGDVIVGLGGALRGVGGVRIGRSHAGERPLAATSPLSLTLGGGVDWLFERREQGLHLELSVLDLGQYLAWDEGAKVTTPDLATALSPSVTLAYAWHRDLPVYVGITVGYTPRYDFAPDGDKPRGSFNAGVTAGIYVPLFDFN